MTHSQASVPARPAPDCQRSFWAWRARHLRQVDDPQAVWAAGWHAGAAAAMYSSSEIAGLVPAVNRLTDYLEWQYAELHDGDLSGSPTERWSP